MSERTEEEQRIIQQGRLWRAKWTRPRVMEEPNSSDVSEESSPTALEDTEQEQVLELRIVVPISSISALGNLLAGLETLLKQVEKSRTIELPCCMNPEDCNPGPLLKPFVADPITGLTLRARASLRQERNSALLRAELD